MYDDGCFCDVAGAAIMFVYMHGCMLFVFMYILSTVFSYDAIECVLLLYSQPHACAYALCIYVYAHHVYVHHDTRKCVRIRTCVCTCYIRCIH